MMMSSRFRATWALALVLVAIANVSSADKKCIEDSFTSMSAILREAEDGHVFLKVDKQYAHGDDSKQYDELCSIYEKTSDERKKQVKIAKVHGDVEEDLAKELGAQDEDSWPTYFLIKQGTTSSDLPKALVKYDGEERSSDKLAEYLHRETGATIGSFVYSLGMMDALAAQFAHASEKDARFGGLQRKVIAYCSKLLGFAITFRAGSVLKMVADLYIKAFFKSLESEDYAEKQIDRIKKLLEKDSNMSNAKREQMSQKLHILTKFTEPKELTASEYRSLLISLAMNVFVFVAFIVLLVQLLLGDGESTEDKVEEKGVEAAPTEEEKESDDDDAKEKD